MYHIATLYLSILSIIALFYNFVAWRLRLKVILAILAIVSCIYSISYQQTEKKKEEIKQENRYGQSEIAANYRAQSLKEKIDESKEKEKSGLFQNSDYLNRICYYLEQLNLIIRNKGNMAQEQFLISYFNQVDKIPTFYTWEEWKETESVIFNHMLQELEGHFSSRGTYGGGAQKALCDEFIKERGRYLKAKEREFNNKSLPR